MATFGHEQRQADVGLGEVGQGGVVQLVQRPALAVDLERVLLEEILGPLVGGPDTTDSQLGLCPRTVQVVTSEG